MIDEPQPLKKKSAANWGGWAVAALLAVVACYLGALWIMTRSQLNVQKDLAKLTSLELRSAEQSIEANRIVTDRQIADLQRENNLAQLKIAPLVAPNDGSSRPVAIVVWDALKQRGVLFVRNLPKLNGDETYQLWADDDHHQNLLNGEAFNVDEQGRGRLDFHLAGPTEGTARFTLRRERKGETATPQGPTVASGTLQ